jgi:hypothetical protein
MSSSWDHPGAQRTVVDLHSYVSYWYIFLAALSAFVTFVKWQDESAASTLAMAIGLAVLALIHRKTSDAAESNKPWVPLASILLAFPLLLSVPIGTWLGIRLMINAPQLKRGAEPS